MKSLPKISLITPSYNQDKFLEETILSVIGQGYPNLEYIIIDGGSNDTSVDIIKKYEKHLTYWVSEKDNGQSHAINKGFAKATGDILCWLNSDDLSMPSTFSFMATLPYSLSDPFIVYGNCIHFKEAGEGVESWGSDVVNAAASTPLENQDFLIQPSTFWSREAWELAGPVREDIHYAFDWEWFLRSKRLGVKFHGVNKCFSMYRIHGEHKTANGGKARQDEILKIYETYSPRYADLYRKVREEDLKFSTLQERIARRSLRFLKKATTSGNLLKHLKSGKYKDYTHHEMDKTISML